MPHTRDTLPDAIDQCLDADEAALAAEVALSNNRGLCSAAGEVDHESVFTGAPPAYLADLSQDAVGLARRSRDNAALAHALTLREDSNYRIDNIASDARGAPPRTGTG